MLTDKWQKATKSNPSGNCVELTYRKAKKSCYGNNCVEVAGTFTTAADCAGDDCLEVNFIQSNQSAAAGHCVEVGFTKASASNALSQCVEVSKPSQDFTPSTTACNCGVVTVDGKPIENADTDSVLLRDSKDKGTGSVFVYTRDQWTQFVAEVKRQGMGWTLTLHRGADKMYAVIDPAQTGTELHFTVAEWDAFLDGINKGEFDLPATDD